MKKLLLILAASLLFQSFSGLSVVQADGSSDHLIYSFDSNAQGWELGTGTGNLDYEVDGDNGYLKLKALAGASYKLKDGIDVVPNAFIEFEKPFKIEADSETVVSVDVRTNNMSTFVRGLMINRDRLNDTVKNELQYNISTLWIWNKSNKLYIYEKNSSTNLGDYMGAKSTKIGEDVLENGVWYTFKTILYSDENGYPEYLKVSIYDGDILKAESEKSKIENGTLKLSDSITRLDIALMQSGVTVPEGGADIDFDNVKIYKVSNSRTWSIANLPGNGILTNAQKIGVSFSGKMDESTLNGTNIKLVKGETELAYQSEYNQSSNIYYIIPTEVLTSGTYSVIIDKSAVNGIDESGNTILGLAGDAKDKIDFTVFNGSIPQVKNIEVSGLLKENSVLKVCAEYYQAEEISGHLEYQWYYADEEDGKYLPIQDEINDEFTVPSQYADKYIKCAIIAVINGGIKGEKEYSDVIKPQKKPEAKNVEIKGMVMNGMEISVQYDFYDENNDKEGKTEFIWYMSDSADGSWSEIGGANSDTLVLTDALEGKYIKAGVTPVSKAEPYKGDKYESAAIGPVESRESLNLAKNPGFETGTTTGWEVKNSDGDSATIVATNEDAYSGEWSGKLSGQVSNSTLLRNYINVKQGITYIVSTMIKVAPESAINPAKLDYYSGVSLSGTVVTKSNSFTATKDEWRQTIAIVVPGGDANKYVLLPQYWAQAGGKDAVFYYDDYYFAPLLIGDVIANVPKSIDIPKSGEVSSAISVSEILNQLGTTDGLDNEVANLEVNADGVYIKDDKLYVTSEATGGTINLKAVVKPSFSGAVQSIYIKSIPVELVAYNTPRITNALLSGDTALGSKATLSYNFYQSDGLNDESIVKWYVSDSENGTYSAIDFSGITLNITDDYSNKYIKAEITPVDAENNTGSKVVTNIVGPKRRPEAKNVTVTGEGYVGYTLKGSYEYYDFNGDKEGTTVIKWLKSDSIGGVYTEIAGANALEYTVAKEDIDCWLKMEVTPVSVNEPYNGDTYETAVVGPIEILNLAKNPGFETGTTTGWEVKNSDGDKATIVATNEDAYSGEWSGKLSGQESNSTLLRNYVDVKKGIKYIVSTMVKVAPESAIDSARMDYYSGVNPSGTEVTDIGSFTATKDEWKQAIALVVPGNDMSKYVLLPQYWSTSGKGGVFYYDDYYFAPLLIGDVIVNAPKNINIPENGEVLSTVSISVILNQLGTTVGMENEVANLETDADGVYIENNNLHVTSDAVSGTINLKVVVKPSFSGAIQSIYVKNIPIELLTNNSKTPKVKNVFLSGNTAVGSKVTLSYAFHQVDGLNDKSIVKWYVSDSENGPYSLIDYSGLALDITEEYSGKFIKAEITPVDAEDNEGSKVVANIAGPPRKPEAKNVTATGKGYVGDTLKGSYEYYDFNRDKEGATVIKWLKSDSKDGVYTEIAGANALEYTVTEDDIDCWLKMEVTPISENEPYNGEPVLSDALLGPTAPTVTNVEISKSGKVLTGKYKFNSINGAEEGITICEWLIDGKVVGTGTTYKVDFIGSKNVEFRVTPVAVSMPYSGKSVSATMTVYNENSVSYSVGGLSSGGGGGGVGSMVSSSILPPLPKTQQSESVTGEDISDVAGHWSEKYAKGAVERGIMTIDSEKNFYPDKKVTRSEIITYIFRALGCNETDYRNEFEDVSASESYAKMLQTMVDMGIISKDINFRPNYNVSRQEVCKILSVALGYSETEVDLTKYTDNAIIGDWAVPYVKNIIYSNLMVGVSETEFSPRTDITNGQIAKIVAMIYAGNYNKPEGGEQTNEQNFGGKIDLSSNDIKVVFIGGSLTQQGKVWQDMTIEALKAKLPGKNITYENMGLGGTGSGYGAFRYQHDVLAKKPDIVFIEFAINDKSAVGINNSRYMEEMVRQSLRSEKVPAITFLYAPDPKAVAIGEFEPWRTGVEYKEKLAQYYGIKSVNISDYMLWDIENQGVDSIKYVNDYYKSTGADSWDVHGGYPKYGEAIVKAIEEDYEAFLTLPKNEAVYHEENAIDINYTVIPAVSENITYTGNWTKCVEGEFKEFDDNSKISEAQFQYFGGALMQTLKGEASFEFKTDAAAVKLQYISSKAGNDAKVYVDGVEKGSVTTYSVNAGMNYDTAWTELPNDSKEHTVKYVIEKPTSGNYAFTFGSIIERR